MADEPISALTLYTSYSTADEIEILDVSDTTFASTGTNKRIPFSTLLTMAGGGNVSNPSGVLNITQSAELTNTPVLLYTPYTAGNEPFQIQGNSWVNKSPGLGYNHSMHFGWNAALFAGGTATPGMPALYMGFEDNYFDYAGYQDYGVEWYVGYCTPDGTTIAPAGLRPFYARVRESNLNTANKDVIVNFDIGSGPNGVFDVYGSQISNNILFSVTQTSVLISQPFVVKASSSQPSSNSRVAEQLRNSDIANR